MSTAPIRVMIVDDQELIRTGFSLMLAAEPALEIIAEASDGRAALAVLERLSAEGKGCDIALMDVRMPGMNGIDATAEIVRRFPDTRVLVLTTFDLDEYALDAIRAGAAGFLLKDAKPEDLVTAITRIAAGDAAMAPSVTRRLIDRIGLSTTPATEENAGEAGLDPELAQLTEREREVLQLIAAGLNNAEISASLFLSESTVKTHVGRVLSKLALRDRVHAVIFAKEHGL
ncbi:DNA-binding NarL/FixJ family response regulator [Leucobacter exalbidus]|uniref:DNA-binding NarL/FixJ family response regulator n=1 Tax=Leucobacter exalbidus TaxID=662960 RepID=A0A940PKY0_9MICO|nr:response regulator transcription factor [Leucobacter exalbidus]MBP1324953.1 DNA-binding NarL/FixJ family response regulator [Leucobacter exalbidus]